MNSIFSFQGANCCLEVNYYPQMGYVFTSSSILAKSEPKVKHFLVDLNRSRKSPQ